MRNPRARCRRFLCFVAYYVVADSLDLDCFGLPPRIANCRWLLFPWHRRGWTVLYNWLYSDPNNPWSTRLWRDVAKSLGVGVGGSLLAVRLVARHVLMRPIRPFRGARGSPRAAFGGVLPPLRLCVATSTCVLR